MKNNFIFSLGFILVLSTQAHAALNLELDMTSQEYRNIFDALEKKHVRIKNHEDPLVAIVELGKRNIDWVNVINQSRDLEHQLHLTLQETGSSIPIDKPSYSSPAIILNNLENFKQEMPGSMRDIIFDNGPLPNITPVDDEIFLQYARKLDRIYKAASRWLLQEPYLKDYISYSYRDIRGYYFLHKEIDLQNKLKNWDNLNEDTKNIFSEWLLGECHNSRASAENCKAEFDKAIQFHDIFNFHAKYEIIAKQVYDAFFEIQNPRPEVVWNNKQPDIMPMPFTSPLHQDVLNWFKTNVEDEYRFANWSLKIDFQSKPNLAKVIFEPGVTPHVDKIGGDVIYMDANRPLNEFASTWTIRHEFGHVLGFPDCYVEFYDSQKKVMVSYYIDTTNLMCARGGHLQEQHYEQLKKYYWRKIS